VTVNMKGTMLEVTTFRADGEYEDFRHPKEVFFTKDIAEDLKRRDFTMNAIAYHPKTGFYDPEKGRKDIEQSLIRGVGEPAERFREDALRMLRALRFSAALGFEIESRTLSAIEECRALIKHISAERIFSELTKLLCGAHPKRIPLLWETGLLFEISSEMGISAKEHSNEIIKHIENLAPDPILRFTAFLRYVNKPADKLRALRADNRTIKLVGTLCEELKSKPPADDYETRKLLCRLGEEAFELLLKLWGESAEDVAARYAAIKKAGDCIDLSGLKVNGGDLFAAGCPKGPMLGELLRYLLDEVHRTPGLNEKEILLEMARQKL
ncbi:MAG: hypothetical protein IJC39_00915, partial [Firmicutes bacterium]|nr:hypothetical protein [Bacillota bacterium]